MYQVPTAVLRGTFRHFRRCGQGRRECQTLWVSPWDAPNIITSAVHPIHASHAFGFALDDRWVTKFWAELSQRNLGVRAQIHTHPKEAFHSWTDDTYPIVQTPSFLSLVIPDYGSGAIGFARAYLTEIQGSGEWQQVEIESRLEVIA